MTAMRSLMCRTTDRSWAMNRYASPSSCCRSMSRLITCDWVETSNELTGSSQINRRGRRASARALAAGELVRVTAEVLGRQPDLAQELGGAGLPLPLAQVLVHRQRLADGV